MVAITPTPPGQRITPQDVLRAEQLRKKMRPVLNASMRQAMADDPKTGIAKQMMQYGGSMDPIETGGIGAIARFGSGMLGSIADKRNRDQYSEASALQGKFQQDKLDQYLAGIDPKDRGAAAGVAGAMGATGAPIEASPQGPPQPPPDMPQAPPGAPPVDPQAAIGVAGAMGGTPPGGMPGQGAPPPNPMVAPALIGRGASPDPQSAILTPTQGNLGLSGGEAQDSLAGGNRSLRAAAGVSRKGLTTGEDIEKMARAVVPNIGVTSRQRSPEKNAKVGGVTNSFHKPDETGVEHARDFVPPEGVSMAALGRRLKAKFGPGFDVINEGNHVHVEPSQQAVMALASGGRISGAEGVDMLQGGDGADQAEVSADGTALGPIEVPDEPEPLAKPDRPAERAKIRSNRLEMVRALMSGGGSPFGADFTMAEVQPYLDKGMDEEQSAREKQYETETGLDKDQFQRAEDAYYGDVNAGRASRRAERVAAQGETWTRQRGNVDYTRDVKKLGLGHRYALALQAAQDAAENIRQDKSLTVQERIAKLNIEAQKQTRAEKRQDALAKMANDPKRVTMYGQFETAANAAIDRGNTASELIDVLDEVAPNGKTNTGKLGEFRALYNRNLQRVDQIGKKLVSDAFSGKLGSGVSNADVELIRGGIPAGLGVDPKLQREYAERVMAISKRDTEYNQQMQNAMLDLTLPQFNKAWQLYKKQVPVFVNGKTNTRAPDYETWLEAATKQGMVK